MYSGDIQARADVLGTFEVAVTAILNMMLIMIAGCKTLLKAPGCPGQQAACNACGGQCSSLCVPMQAQSGTFSGRKMLGKAAA